MKELNDVYPQSWPRTYFNKKNLLYIFSGLSVLCPFYLLHQWSSGRHYDRKISQSGLRYFSKGHRFWVSFLLHPLKTFMFSLQLVLINIMERSCLNQFTEIWMTVLSLPPPHPKTLTSFLKCKLRWVTNEMFRWNIQQWKGGLGEREIKGLIRRN